MDHDGLLRIGLFSRLSPEHWVTEVCFPVLTD